jgi:Protein of unknown function (DUF1579)
MKRSIFASIALVVAFAITWGQVPPPELQDRFLNDFVGEWRVERKFGNGRIAETTVRGEWTLKHQFIELHYGSGGSSPEYEAIVFIGFDDADKTYVCHWVDVFGARYSSVGRGKIDEELRAIEFRFDSKDGGLTNKFTFDWQTKVWISLIRQQEKGEWKTFAEEKWMRK